jgi:hypothetical protein
MRQQRCSHHRRRPLLKPPGSLPEDSAAKSADPIEHQTIEHCEKNFCVVNSSDSNMMSRPLGDSLHRLPCAAEDDPPSR